MTINLERRHLGNWICQTLEEEAEYDTLMQKNIEIFKKNFVVDHDLYTPQESYYKHGSFDIIVNCFHPYLFEEIQCDVYGDLIDKIIWNEIGNYTEINIASKLVDNKVYIHVAYTVDRL
jgi:hypothetical protein